MDERSWHTKHVSWPVAADLFPYVPAGHRLHPEEPSDDLKDPGGHATQAPVPSRVCPWPHWARGIGAGVEVDGEDDDNIDAEGVVIAALHQGTEVDDGNSDADSMVCGFTGNDVGAGVHVLT